MSRVGRARAWSRLSSEVRPVRPGPQGQEDKT